MGDQQLSSSEYTSEAPLATFMAVKGHQLLMRLLLVMEIRL